MKKMCLFILFFILLIFGSFISYLYIYRSELSSEALSRALSTPVTIEKISFSKNGVSLEKVTVKNPKECSLQPAFSAQAIEISMSWQEIIAAFFSNRRIEIDEIRIEKPFVGIELFKPDGSESNWKFLIHKLANKSKKTQKLFFIHTIEANDISLEVLTRSKNSPVKRIEQIAHIEFKEIAPSSLSQILYQICKESLIQIGQTLKEEKLTESIQNIETAT